MAYTNKLKELRKKRNLRQQDIANHLSVAKSTYSYWENGKIEISNENLFKLSAFFDVTIDYLLGNSDIPTLPTTDSNLKEQTLKEALALKGVKGTEHIKMLEDIIEMMAKSERNEEISEDTFLDKGYEKRQSS